MPRRHGTPLWALLLAAATHALAVVAAPPSAALEAQCARFETAQNASLQLQWQLLGAGAGGPFTRIAHTAAALSGPPRVLVIGGIEYESAQPVVVNTTIVYDPQADAFRLPADAIASTATPVAPDDVFSSPAARAEHASAVAGASVVLLFGGQNAAFLNDLWRACVGADSAQTKWDQFVVPASDAVSLAATPAARIGHSLVVTYENATHTGALVYGGLSDAYEDVGATVSLALVARSPVQGACNDRSPRVHWRTLRIASGSTQPDARAYHSAAPVSRLFSPPRMACMLLFGGRSTRTNLIYGDVWRLCSVSSGAVESQTYQWEQLVPIGSRDPGPRYGAAIAFIDEGKVAVAGGSYAFPNDFLSDVWEFNINATQWLSLRFDADFTPPRRGHAITLLGDRLYLFGGRDRYSVVNRRMQVTTYAAPYCASGLKITLCEATSTYVCVPCPAGYFLEAGTRNCLSCDAGTYSGEGAAACTKCPMGTYNPLTAQTRLAACVACPSGSYSGTEGATSNATCLACAAGTFAASAGANSCASCPAGTFSNASASACTPCPVGQWSATAAAQCSKCSAGSYNPRNGSAVCFPCPMGFYSDLGVAQCSHCPVNTFSSSVSTAGATGCSSCPPLTFTGGAVGSSACQYCPPGNTLSVDGASCQPCPKGTYSQADTYGACTPCPLHSYSNATTGATVCELCPTGTLTLATGATASTDCRVCASSTQVFNGQSCSSCSPGAVLVATTVPNCEACGPGTYTSSNAEASLSSGCQLCPTMAVAAVAGATSCAVCPDGSYAMAAWRSCISCSTAFLSECPVGRNGQLCSGNGVCVLRGCNCSSGWTGGDCSTPSSTSLASSLPSVLFFPLDQTYVVQTRAPLASTFEIRIGRAGSLVGELRARVQVKSTNTSTLPAGVFPASVSTASGMNETKLTLSPTAFASSTVGPNCRSLTLELVDVSSPSSPSMVASEAADRTITLFFDDMNGVSGGSGTSQPRSLTISYTLGRAGNEAAAPLDRAVSTKLRLQPPDSISLSTLPLNLRIAIDPATTDSVGIADILPAAIARIQTAYSASAIVRVGSLHPNSNGSIANIYQAAPDFYTGLKRVVASSSSAALITWQWLVDRIKATNTTQWRVEDASQRRFLVVFLAAGTSSGDTTVLAATLRQNGLFAFVVLPPGQTAPTSTPNDVIQFILLASSASEIPQKLVAALQQRDASPASAFVASVLTDSASLVQSGSSVTVSIGNPGLPTFELTLNAMPASVSNGTVQISLPGFALLTVTLREPGASCYAVQRPETLLPMNEEPMSGWVGAWHMLTDTQWRRVWTFPSGAATTKRYNDSSLLRTTRTSVLAITSTVGTRQVTLERVFDGSLAAPGLDLIAKAFARHSGTLQDGASCALSLQLAPVNATKNNVVQAQSVFTTHPDWVYVRLSSVVPFEVASMRLRLDCNTSLTVDTVELTSLGLFPDPQVACLCPRGSFYDAGACFRCPAGSYCVAGIKRECPLGYFSFGKADHCERCRDGWICVDGLVRLCDPGTYAAPGSSCLVCPSGYACRNGMKQVCPAGTFSLAQSSDCQLCPPGTISVNEGSSSCSLCPLGSTSNFNRDHCFPCPPGETTTYRGQHPCSSCTATAFLSRDVAEVCVATS